MPKELPPKRRMPRLRYWIIAAVCAVVSISTAFAARTLHVFVRDDPRFALDARSGVTIQGSANTPSARVLQVFSADFNRSIFEMNIAERRRRLLAIDWISDASVARVWPNRVIVTIHERQPVAFVTVPHRPFLLVDGEGVLLIPPTRASFEFPVLSGIQIDQTEADRKVRVQAALRMIADLGPAGKDISEVNAAVPDDLRLTTQMNGRVVELWMGDQNFNSRYRNMLDHFTVIAARSPRASVFDLRVDDRIYAK